MADGFWALDVETANADYSSICQIGMVYQEAGLRTKEWSTLINPNDYFDSYNTGIHGIDAQAVSASPTFPEVFRQITERLTGEIVIHHGHFDRTAFNRCYDLHELDPIGCSWLDNTKIVRRTWPEFSQSGYGLKNLSVHFGIPLNHHDALSDAAAAARIADLAVLESGKGLKQWLIGVRRRAPRVKDYRRDGDPDAPFFGEKIVFTGTLSVPRNMAADEAQKLGFDVQNNVTKKTTFVCVGIQDRTVLKGYDKSSKHRKAEQLISDGHEISIMSEQDFWAIARVYETGEVS